MYEPRFKPAHESLTVNGLQYRLHCWGDSAAPPLFLLHGWADTGMSFQFLADIMADDWYLIAPDWRGFGDSEWCDNGYWFPDYLADLEIILGHFSADRPVRLVGHSMGGNIAWLYAGIRPDRVSHAASLDAYGLPDSDGSEAPMHYARWLEQLGRQQSFSSYPDLDSLGRRISCLAPRLDQGRASYLAGHWSKADSKKRLYLKHDPRHKRVNPVLYRREEARQCWARISAKILLVLASESRFNQHYQKDGYHAELQNIIPRYRDLLIRDSGHMLHLEQPARLATILSEFMAPAE